MKIKLIKIYYLFNFKFNNLYLLEVISFRILKIANRPRRNAFFQLFPIAIRID